MPQIALPADGVFSFLPAGFYRWPNKVVATIDIYVVDFTTWVSQVVGDVLTSCTLAATPAGVGQLSMSPNVVLTGAQAAALIGFGEYGQDYSLMWVGGTQQGRALAIPTQLYCSPSLVPSAIGSAGEALATSTSVGVVSVPVGSGLSVSPNGNLSLSGIGLPTSPVGLSSGTPWNDGGLLALAP